MSRVETEESTLLATNTRIVESSWSRRILIGLAMLGCIVLVAHGSQEHSQEMDDFHVRAMPQDEMTDGIVLGAKEAKKKKKKSKEEPPEDGDMDYCLDGHYSKRTLQLAYELPFTALFIDHKGQKKHEASSVILVNDTVYAVCDSSWAISKFSRQLQPFANDNALVGDPYRDPNDESGYEALFYDEGTFYVIRESVLHDDDTYHAIVEELSMILDSTNQEVDYDVNNTCSCEYEFEGDSKGFEGAIPVHDLDGNLVILGLCEGNHCSETKKNDRGNGRLVAMRKSITTDEDGTQTCQWDTIREIKIPDSAYFKDYSAIDMQSEGRVLITSQEDSRLWVGQMLGQVEGGLWDINAIEFDWDESKVYDFPKNDQCVTNYCNIEGIHWINDEMVIAVSDKMKSKGKQDFRCFEKDQSVHVFVLP